jgi:hypothetical protein
MKAKATTRENRTVGSFCFRTLWTLAPSDYSTKLTKSELCDYAVSDTRSEFRSGSMVFAQVLPGAMPETYGPRAACNNRFVRWRQAGISVRIMDTLAAACRGGTDDRHAGRTCAPARSLYRGQQS